MNRTEYLPKYCRKFGLLLAALAWSLLCGTVGANPNLAGPVTAVPAPALNGVGHESPGNVPIRMAPLSQSENGRGSASVVLPMAIFCGMLLSSLSIAIGIGYKRRFDNLAADQNDDSLES